MRRLFHCFLIVAVCFISVPPLYGIDVENISSIESISTQSVGGDDIISPYHITGESLVQLMQKMVNFDISGSNIIFNRRTGQIFIRNTPSNHDTIETILSDLRSAQYRQVEIEARIITVSATDIDDIGLDFLEWNAVSSHKNTDFGTLTELNSGQNLSAIDFPNVTDAAGNDLGGQLSFAAQGSSFSIDAFIDALKSYAEINTLSAPHLIVANNQRANIRIEKAQYYVQSVKTDADSTQVAVDPEIGVASSGTILDVTPTINSDGTISLELHPQFVRVDISNTQTVNVAGPSLLDDESQPSVTLPVFTVQSTDTTITIENGGVALIGGLIEEREEYDYYKG